ncbi:MAG: Sugar transferases involved in lipopolysaccharide synthesis [Bacteroidetes bacterium HLUCCA01]|nr:MAG: Sugar transferases involved in lipopolysaccharide synthesis [Bacteroidetes bacterium HLUCCA01]
MDSFRNILNTFFADVIALTGSWYLFYFVRFELGIIPGESAQAPIALFVPALVICVFWLIVFAIFGLYKNLYLISRFDEFLRVGKVTLLGTLILFFVLFIDNLGWTNSNIQFAKTYTLSYWLVVFLSVWLLRLVVRTYEIVQVKKGRGLHRAVIVGTGHMARDIRDNLERNRTSGMNVIGFVSESDQMPAETTIGDVPVIGTLSDLRTIIQREQVKDVIAALEQEDTAKLIRIVDEIDVPDVSVKIVPNFLNMITGLNQTNQIFGLPLIEVMPDPMPSWEKFTKRTFDIILSLCILVVTAPLFLVLIVLIKITSPGPAVFSQERLGLYGKPFIIYKFRTMYEDAEARSGPVWATENDPRITPLGFWLRKLRLDEIPQLYNVLKGDMSLVGPRPERAHFVNKFKKEIPLYTRRLRVRPGITGWAQVKWKYDESMEDVIEKTKYDLFYVENMSLRMDFKILLNTIATVVRGKGQ